MIFNYRTSQKNTPYSSSTVETDSTPAIAAGIAYTAMPFGINPEQAWFWTEQWQAKETEADADLAAGRYSDYEDIDSFLDSL